MTMENLLSQMGIGTKQLTDRYSGEYGAPGQDQPIYYAYEPSQPSHEHTASPKHHYSGGGGLKSNASMSALTLLAFLFFLHILQQCIKEHMTEMNNAPVVVMSASRETNDDLTKVASKIDKSGVTQSEDEKKEYYATNPYKNIIEPEDKMMRINAAEHKPKRASIASNVYAYDNHGNSALPGFVRAMDDD